MTKLSRIAYFCLTALPAIAGEGLDGTFGFAAMGYSHHSVTLANIDITQIGLTSGKHSTTLKPGPSFDVGPQSQYFTVLPGFLVINPSVTYNFCFTNGPDKVDGRGLNFETLAAVNVLPVLALQGSVGYDIHNLKMQAPGGIGDKAQFRDFAFRLGLAFGGSN